MVDASTKKSAAIAENAKPSAAFQTVSASTTFVNTPAQNAPAVAFAHMEKNDQSVPCAKADLYRQTNPSEGVELATESPTFTALVCLYTVAEEKNTMYTILNCVV